MSFRMFLSFLLFLSLTSVANAANGDGCVADCGEFGVCVNKLRTCNGGDSCEKVCKCNPNYIGDDCSTMVAFCSGTVNPDGTARTCFNGGTCIKERHYDGLDSDGGDLVYWCDCSTAVGEAGGGFAGHQCEFPHEKSCEIGTSTSSYAFCVNGGECANLVSDGEPHPGCSCGKQYEGRHCQYERGTAPAYELGSQPLVPLSDGMSAGLVFIVVAVALGGFAGGIFIYVTKNKNSNKTNEKMVEYDTSGIYDNDTHADQGGNSVNNELHPETFEGDEAPAAENAEII